MKYQPRTVPPKGNEIHLVAVAIDAKTFREAQALRRLEYKKYYSFGHFVGELIRGAVEENRLAQKERDGGVREDLTE